MFVVIWDAGLGDSQNVLTFMSVCCDLAISEGSVSSPLGWIFTAYQVITLHSMQIMSTGHFYTHYHVETF